MGTLPTADKKNSKVVVFISDFVTGRIKGGHQSDYLAALEVAVSQFGAVTIAPYRDEYTDDAGFLQISPTASGFGLYWKRLRQFHNLLRNRQVQLILFPSPEFLDFVVFFGASILRVSKHSTVALFVFRRDAAGIIGRVSWKSRLIYRMVRWLAKRHYLYPISDSMACLTYWEAITGLQGSLVSIPIRRLPVVSPPKRAGDPLTIGLIGLFRLEKGAAMYDRVITEAFAFGLSTPE